MKTSRLLRYSIIGILMFLGVCWSLTKAAEQEAKEAMEGYPNAHLLATASWLKAHIDDESVIVVDVRTDEYLDNELIPGSVRLPWRTFQYNDPALYRGSVFVGIEEAQKILGAAGVMRADTVVLYDSVERDGGATSSYVFWVLDMLGHENIKVLNGGIDAWKREGGATVSEPAKPDPVVYQAKPEAVMPRRWGKGRFVYERLGDPYYQIIDVRSHAEYIGEQGNTGLNEEPLKLGHIPGAYNVEYKKAWVDAETTLIKPYAQLQELYRGLDPSHATVVYCHSGRRGSFSYFILRLMGFRDPILYEASWTGWGNYRNYFPAEMEPNEPTSGALPGAVEAPEQRDRQETGRPSQQRDPEDQSSTGYVSCGG